MTQANHIEDEKRHEFAPITDEGFSEMVEDDATFERAVRDVCDSVNFATPSSSAEMARRIAKKIAACIERKAGDVSTVIRSHDWNRREIPMGNEVKEIAQTAREAVAALVAIDEALRVIGSHNLPGYEERNNKIAWKAPTGEDATGCNAGIYSQVYKDVIGVVERERLTKQDNSPARRKNYAKETTWQNQLVNSLVQRIMNLRLINAALRRANEEVWEKAATIADQYAAVNKEHAIIPMEIAARLREAARQSREDEGK